jgi:hypothetical protein
VKNCGRILLLELLKATVQNGWRILCLRYSAFCGRRRGKSYPNTDKTVFSSETRWAGAISQAASIPSSSRLGAGFGRFFQVWIQQHKHWFETLSSQNHLVANSQSHQQCQKRARVARIGTSRQGTSHGSGDEVDKGERWRCRREVESLRMIRSLCIP